MSHPHAEIAPRATVDATLTPAARSALEAAIPHSTRRAYARERKAFTDWCASYDRTPIPATAQTLAAYVTHLTTTPSPRTRRPRAPGTIKGAVAAIRTMHKLASVPPPETKAALKILSGYSQALALAKDSAAVVRRADPATPDTLRAMLGVVDRDTFGGKRDAALLLLGYATAARVSELALLDIGDVVETPEGLLITIYRRKIKKYTETAVPYGSNPATCPVRATRALLAAMADHGRTSGPLLIRVDRHDNIAPPMTRYGKTIGDPHGRMTAEGVAEVVTRIADAAGLEGRWTGHSLRRGFATAARRQGHALERIGRHGGWADGSASLLGYIEEGDRWTDNPVTGL